MWIMVRLIDDAHATWERVPYLRGSGVCDHTDTVCADCLGTWMIDYRVATPTAETMVARAPVRVG